MTTSAMFTSVRFLNTDSLVMEYVDGTELFDKLTSSSNQAFNEVDAAHYVH